MSVQRNLLISQQNQAIYEALKRSMVLWYDVKRQGATNESMAANPKLLDLSGNGYDADCHNFAWSGVSGIGESLFSSLTRWYKTPNNDGEYTVSDTQLHITKTTNNPSLYYYINNNKTIHNNTFIDSYTENSITLKPFKVKVSGLPENYNVVIDGIYAVEVGSDNYKVPEITVGNGEHVCDFGTIETAITIGPDYQFQFPKIFTDMPAGTICDVTVELLPGYPDALVFDGVDDYAAVFPFSFIPHSIDYSYNNGEYTTGFFTSSGWRSMSQGTITKIPSPFKIRISGISGIEPDSTPCVVFLWNETERVMKPISPTFVEDGVYTVADIDPLPELTPGVSYSMFIDLNSYIGHDVKIDILPDETKALPLFIPEPGFTVIAKRTIISGSTSSAPVAAKSADDTNSSFKLEYQYHHNKYDNFGGINNVTHPELVTYQTAHKINGSPAVSGDLSDCNFLCLAKFRPRDSRALNMALYSFILFDRDLTEEEINWVKNNLIEENFNHEICYSSY